MVLGIRTAGTPLGSRIKGLSEDINYFLPVIREMLLDSSQDVHLITVRLLLCQILVILRDEVLECRALNVPALLLQKVVSTGGIKVPKDLAVLLVA